jgi:hypothetical protein
MCVLELRGTQELKRRKTMNNKYNLGDKIRDSVVGVSGVVTGVSELLSGCIRYLVGVSATTKEKYYDIYTDETNTSLIKKSSSDVKILPFKFELGDEVKDIISGAHFAIMSRSRYLAGYNRYSCQKINGTDVKDFDWIYFDEAQL